MLCKTEGGDVYIGEVWPGDTAFPDFVTEDGRTWWGELNAAHVQSGLAGIWNDMNEPATGAMPPERMRFNRGQDSHERWHNQYALLMAMGTREGLLEAMPELRTFILSRAGFAGIQRYAANWMGDNQARWDHLWLSIPMANGFGLSGQPFVGADVGGFAGHSNAELFLRWLQYGALTPFCRNHSMLGDVDQYAWAWGDAVLAEARRAIELRYRLLPYIYSAFITATETGAPVQRPLVFDHQYDAAVRDIDDQYLFGPDLLVAPVYEPRTTARQVYLPAGEWYDWHTGERFTGPRFVIAETPMDRIPLYARAGAVIPMWPSAPASTDERPDVIELHVFDASDAETHVSFLQEDDGLTLDGPARRTRARAHRQRGARDERGRPTKARAWRSSTALSLSAQLALEDLPARVLRQLVDEDDGLGDLERGEVLAGERAQLVRLDRLAGDDDRADGLDPAVVGDADDRDLGDRGMPVQDLLDLARGDVLAARVDHVLLAVDDRQVAVRVHRGEVAAVEPAARERGLGALGIVVVARGHLDGAVHDLPHLARPARRACPRRRRAWSR